MGIRVAAAGFFALSCALPAGAAPKVRVPPVAKLATTVNLENKRPLSLLSFEIVMPAKDKSPETVVAKLEKPLLAGEQASLPLSGAKGCMFEARWKFADLNDAGPVDLCSDAHIVLID